MYNFSTEMLDVVNYWIIVSLFLCGPTKILVIE